MEPQIYVENVSYIELQYLHAFELECFEEYKFVSEKSTRKEIVRLLYHHTDFTDFEKTIISHYITLFNYNGYLVYVEPHRRTGIKLLFNHIKIYYMLQIFKLIHYIISVSRVPPLRKNSQTLASN
jgi:hypothetical protein